MKRPRLAIIRPEFFHDGKVQLYAGNCLAVLDQLPGDSIDACCTDPPYHLSTMSKPRPDLAGKGNMFAARQAKMGFMGKEWDGGDISFRPETWAKVLRVLKPGAYLVAFGGTRTYHRLACAIEDAGFEVRDTLTYHYGSGFPKSLDVSKGIDKKLGAKRKIIGPGRGGLAGGSGNTVGRFTGLHAITEPATDAARQWQGWGTALKPSTELIVLARKPLIGSVAKNVLAHDTGALNIDACRIELAPDDPLQDGVKHDGHPLISVVGFKGLKAVDRPPGLGRWPANTVTDGSQPQLRYFYTAKADGDDRLGSYHPTVKPVDLMQWLVRLMTPPGGTVLDPFAGTGSTGEAAWREGMKAVLIDREAEYQDDIRRRMALCMAGRERRRWAHNDARPEEKPTGLFAFLKDSQ